MSWYDVELTANAPTAEVVHVLPKGRLVRVAVADDTTSEWIRGRSVWACVHGQGADGTVNADRPPALTREGGLRISGRLGTEAAPWRWWIESGKDTLVIADFDARTDESEPSSPHDRDRRVSEPVLQSIPSATDEVVMIRGGSRSDEGDCPIRALVRGGEAGVPLSGWKVVARRKMDGLVRSGETDRTGQVSFRAPPGLYDVDVAKSLAPPRRASVDVPSPEAERIVLDVTGRDW